jgi:hypothetical protein
MENEDLYRNLVILLKMFKNRPYHLAKYLIENDSLTKDFMKKISENGKLAELGQEDKPKGPVYFLDIGKMNDYYASLSDENVPKTTHSPEEVEEYLNAKLDSLIDEEKYEDAARLRDYMAKNKIKRHR